MISGYVATTYNPVSSCYNNLKSKSAVNHGITLRCDGDLSIDPTLNPAIQGRSPS